MNGRRPRDADPFLAFHDRARVEDAVAARVRERELRERVAEVAGWVGTLRDLVELRVRLSIVVDGGRTHHGWLLAVGVDHLAIRIANGSTVLIASDIVRAVRPEPGARAPVASGDRPRSHDRRLVSVLASYLEDADELVLLLRGVDDPVTGSMLGLGEDVLTVRLAGSGQGTVYVPTQALAEVVIPG